VRALDVVHRYAPLGYMLSGPQRDGASETVSWELSWTGEVSRTFTVPEDLRES
jgi:hypothetical protein